MRTMEVEEDCGVWGREYEVGSGTGVGGEGGWEVPSVSSSAACRISGPSMLRTRRPRRQGRADAVLRTAFWDRKRRKQAHQAMDTTATTGRGASDNETPVVHSQRQRRYTRTAAITRIYVYGHGARQRETPLRNEKT